MRSGFPEDDESIATIHWALEHGVSQIGTVAT
jgi:hypothetical protein